MTDLLRSAEPLARRAWPPLFLSTIVVITWTLVDNFGDVVYTQTAVKMFLMLMIVLGLQIFSGNSGVLSFGHIAFMAIGAYMSALLQKLLERSLVPALQWLHGRGDGLGMLVLQLVHFPADLAFR